MQTVTFGSLKEGDKFRLNLCFELQGKTLTKLKGVSTAFNDNHAREELVGYYQKPDGSVRHMFNDGVVEVPTPFKRKEWVLKSASEIPSGSIVRCKSDYQENVYTLAKSASGHYACLVLFRNGCNTNICSVDLGRKGLLVEEEVLVTNEFEEEKGKDDQNR